MNLLTIGTTPPMAGMAMFGKTAFVLLIILAIIFAVAYVLRRIGGPSGLTGQRLKVVSSIAVGQRERVVLVQVEKTWLVLGVGGGQVNRLHEMPAPEGVQVEGQADTPEPFAKRLAQVISRRDGSQQ